MKDGGTVVFLFTLPRSGFRGQDPPRWCRRDVHRRTDGWCRDPLDCASSLTPELAGTPCSEGLPCTLKAAYMEPSEFTDLASTPQERLVGEVERVRRVLRD